MPKHVRLLALGATLSVSALLLTACATGGSSEPSTGPSGESPVAALAAAYAGVSSEQSLIAVDFPTEVQNVAIISCPLSIPSCAASAAAVPPQPQPPRTLRDLMPCPRPVDAACSPSCFQRDACWRLHFMLNAASDVLHFQCDCGPGRVMKCYICVERLLPIK